MMGRASEIIVAVVVVLAWALAAPGQQATALPPGKTIASDDFVKRLNLQGPELDYVSREVVEGKNQPHGAIVRATLERRPGNFWNTELSARLPGAIRKNDAVLATFHARAVPLKPGAPARAQFEFAFQRTIDASNLVTRWARLGPEWTTFQVPFWSWDEFAANQVRLTFKIGFDPQCIEITGLQVTNHGPGVKDLPYAPPITYDGREPDAAWRKEALERIERIRKAELSVRVTDPAGAPIPGAAVKATLKRHSFGFGTAVRSDVFFGTGGQSPEDVQKYRAALTELFNEVTLEHDLRPMGYGWWDEARRQQTVELTRWLADHHLPICGHYLFGAGYGEFYVPTDRDRERPSLAIADLVTYTEEQVGRFRDSVRRWVVINDPIVNNRPVSILGVNGIAEMFRVARHANPNAALIANEHDILEGGDDDWLTLRDPYDEFVQSLIRDGAAIDGIGMQGHFTENLTSPVKMLQVLDRFGAIGKPIHVTEFDVRTNDGSAYADFTRDLLIVLYSHPSVSGITTWGFWDGAHWRWQAPHYDQQWNLKPAGKVWRDLVLDQWRTRAEGKTDGAGTFTTRGHLGTYEITVDSNGKSKTLETTLPKEGQTVTVKLD